MRQNDFVLLQKERIERRIRYIESVLPHGGVHAQHKAQLLPSLHRAMQKIELGIYESCDACGGVIPRDRLRAVPGALYCAPCQAVEKDVRHQKGALLQ
jgi:hypothetical protein